MTNPTILKLQIKLLTEINRKERAFDQVAGLKDELRFVKRQKKELQDKLAGLEEKWKTIQINVVGFHDFLTNLSDIEVKEYWYDIAIQLDEIDDPDRAEREFDLLKRVLSSNAESLNKDDIAGLELMKEDFWFQEDLW